ncbi:hypothetical protein ScPMuIL_015756 [Solemya velum]
MSGPYKLLHGLVKCPVCHVGHIPPISTLKENGVYAGTCGNCGHFFKFQSVAPYRSSITFFINGSQYTIGNEYDPATSLNEYLRASRISTGTKYMCREGGCGTCMVNAKLFNVQTQSYVNYAINSCLCPLYMIDGWEVTTVEGIGSKQKGYHPIQQRLGDYNGTQCGFCSPGHVMNMYSLLARNPNPTKQEVEDSFGGVVCRCTGYRSILDAMKSFASNSTPNPRLPPTDIEDLSSKLCKKTGAPCTGNCRPRDPRGIHMVFAGAQWFSPSTLQELYSLMTQYKDKSQRLVFGNTATGVYKQIGPWSYDVLFNIRGIHELETVSFANLAHIGANVSLTQLMDIFGEVDPSGGFAYLRSLVEHIAKVGHTNVRNSGSWAGNLMMKQQFPDFPSDIFVILEAIGAQLALGGQDIPGQELVSLLKFMDTSMTGKAILYMVLPQLSASFYIRTYKVMPRSQNAFAYVNAGIVMELDPTNNFLCKQKPSIVYGGISKTFVHASKTEEYLKGKQLGDPTVIKEALNTLSSEVVPDVGPALSTVEYRKSLALSLFYRYVLSVLGDKVGLRFRSGASPLTRPLSSGQQSYGTKKIEWPLTQPLPKLGSILQTSGEAQYITDIPPIPGQLYASFVLSTVGNAKIQTIDPADALKIPGVFKFISASDIPEGGKNDFMPSGNPEEILCSGQVLFTSQALGIIVADNQITADDGAKAVKVTYTDIQSPITNISDGIQKQSFFPKPVPDLVVGDAEKAIANSPKTFSGTIGLGAQYHFHTETQISICNPTEDGMDVWTSTQWIDGAMDAIASVLNIEKNSINVEVKRVGGAFGAKITRNSQVAAGCALAARIMNRPVRMMLNIHDNMEMIGKRIPYYAEYQVTTQFGWDCSSRSQYSIWDNGILSELGTKKDDANNSDDDTETTQSEKTCRSAKDLASVFLSHRFNQIYVKDSQFLNLRLVTETLLQKGSNVVTLGTISGVHSVLEQVAIPPFRILLRSIFAPESSLQLLSNLVHCWQTIPIPPVVRRLHISGALLHYEGLAPYCTTVLPSTLDVFFGLVSSQTRVVPLQCFCKPTHIFFCPAIIECCQILITKMAPVKAKMVDPTWQQLVQKCLEEGIDLTARYFIFPNTEYVFQYNSYGVTCTEVDLDVLTGENQIARVDLLYDCGESLNPAIDVGQAEGAFVFGLGYWLMEELKFDPKSGQLITNSTLNYHPPTTKDIPIDFRVQFLKDAPNPVGVLRSKAVGEPPLCMSASAMFALKHAVEAARQDIGKDTYFPLYAPATVEKLQSNCLLDISQFIVA